eukprot:m.72053 g.72053  ORF g.72053 m.72053 type:complete len:218 (-) comp12324_c0_seq1:454-1107(-)
MSGNVRYSQVPTQESDSHAVEVPLMAVEVAPAYDAPNAAVSARTSVLPTYEETQRAKHTESSSSRTKQQDTSSQLVDGQFLGSDLAFVQTLLLSFFFNAIGFLLALCLATSLAGRCGAISGFGLSLVKVAVLFYHFGYLMSSSDNDTSLAEFNVTSTATPSAVYEEFADDDMMGGQDEQKFNQSFLMLLGALGFLVFIHGVSLYLRAKAKVRRSLVL